MIFGNLFSAPEVKIFKKYSSQFLDEFENSLTLTSFSRYTLIKNLKTDIDKMAATKEMLQILTDSNPPHFEYQALHGIGQIIIHYLGRPPLVDIGGGSFCSADYRDALGQLTDEGRDLKTVLSS